MPLSVGSLADSLISAWRHLSAPLVARARQPSLAPLARACVGHRFAWPPGWPRANAESLATARFVGARPVASGSVSAWRHSQSPSDGVLFVRFAHRRFAPCWYGENCDCQCLVIPVLSWRHRCVELYLENAIADVHIVNRKSTSDLATQFSGSIREDLNRHRAARLARRSHGRKTGESRSTAATSHTTAKGTR